MEVVNVPLIPLYLFRLTAHGLNAHERKGHITKSLAGFITTLNQHFFCVLC